MSKFSFAGMLYPAVKFNSAAMHAYTGTFEKGLLVYVANMQIVLQLFFTEN